MIPLSAIALLGVLVTAPCTEPVRVKAGDPAPCGGAFVPAPYVVWTEGAGALIPRAFILETELQRADLDQCTRGRELDGDACAVAARDALDRQLAADKRLADLQRIIAERWGADTLDERPWKRRVLLWAITMGIAGAGSAVAAVALIDEARGAGWGKSRVTH